MFHFLRRKKHELLLLADQVDAATAAARGEHLVPLGKTPALIRSAREALRRRGKRRPRPIEPKAPDRQIEMVLC